jgi:hypothetical protein
VHHWIIGNEPNHEQEWPGGMKIYPDEYGRCYVKCRDAIKAQAGHERDQVLVAAIAPWTAKVTYSGNERGDWVQYLGDVIASIGDADGYALHTYTHTHDVREVTSDAKMGPPFEDRFFQFLAYRDFMAVVPRGAPVYITETCPAESGWMNVNNGWVRNVYAEIDRWNQSAETPIRCLTLYRGVPVDRWYFADKGNVRIDWELAKGAGYEVDIDDGGIEMGLANGGFEQGFRQWQGIGELNVGNSWEPFWREKQTGDPDWKNRRPEYKDATSADDPKRVYAGEHAQQWFNWSGTSDSGVWQIVGGLQAGAKVRFRAQVQQWCVQQDNSPADGNARLRIGADPTGGRDPWAGSVHWSEISRPANDTFVEVVTPAVTVEAGSVTVFVRCDFEWAVRDNNAYVDQVEMEVLSEPGPGPTPGPHRVRVYLDDVLVAEGEFEAQAAGITFRAVGGSRGIAHAPRGLLGWLARLWQ